MKKHLVIILFLLTVSLFSQFEITKHECFTSVGTGFMLNAERFTGNSLTNIGIPYGSYKLEGKTNEKALYYLYADGGLNLNKFSPADELPQNELPGFTNESFAYDLQLSVNPMMKYFSKDSTFITLGLPFSLVSKQKLNNDATDLVTATEFLTTFTSKFGYDTRDIEFHVLSPWDKFEEGWAAFGFFDYGLLRTYSEQGLSEADKENVKKTESLFGVEGYYSYLMEDQKLLLKPILRYEKQLNSDLNEYWWFTTKVFTAWDYSKKINVNGTLGMKFGETGEKTDDPDYNPRNNLAGNTTWFMIEGEVNYYVKPKLNLFFGFKGESLLFAVQNQDEWQRNASELNIKLGATYELNFINEY